ncbi:AbrB/MazE/SpoVT family DNA-binding domain-containing protein [Massilia timonae]|uniref:AbrB/MazE/SpoVT family DNA-binding domain-containing protein n=1 Tax=Massilia timonae TaxID=47229 RepID=UPI00351DA452
MAGAPSLAMTFFRRFSFPLLGATHSLIGSIRRCRLNACNAATCLAAMQAVEGSICPVSTPPTAPQLQGCVNLRCTHWLHFMKEAGMARLTKWGNSVGGLRLPKAIVDAAGLRVGDEVSCRLLDSGEILLTPARGKIEIKTSGNSVVTPSQVREK